MSNFRAAAVIAQRLSAEFRQRGQLEGSVGFEDALSAPETRGGGAAAAQVSQREKRALLPCSDPFDSATDAIPSECEVRTRTWGKEKARCDVASKAKKRKTDLNPFQRRWFEKNGWTYARVEHANAFGAVNQDLWGIADFLAVRPGEIVLVQTTDHTHAANREKKIRAAPELAKWLEAGGKFQVHSWRQRGGPGTKWEMDVRDVGLAPEAAPKGRTR